MNNEAALLGWELDPDVADEVRCALALVAAAVGVLICLYQRHFTLHLHGPHGLYTMTTHRCGLVMLAAVVWMAVECISLTWKRSWRFWAVRG